MENQRSKIQLASSATRGVSENEYSIKRMKATAEKRDIESEEDVETLVHAFYQKVREHTEIGHFFNETIEDWDAHLDTLTKFWMANLFGESGYTGNPMKSHIEVDRSFDNQIEQAHFGYWLQLWFSTIDSMFAGAKANLAKERARNIAHITFIKIYQARRIKTN